jgi:uncharacterized RDD family membrane protein YckC
MGHGADGLDDEPGDGGFVQRVGRAALRPAKAVARTGRSALADEAERTIDAVLAGPMPEAVARSLINNNVVERVVTEAIDAAQLGTGSEVDEQLERAVERVVESPAFKRVLTEVLSSPELRHALTRQTGGFGHDLMTALRRQMRRLDGRLSRRGDGFGGIASRGVALAVDAVFAQIAFLIAGATVVLITSLIRSVNADALYQSLVGVAWALSVTAYFVGFWSIVGQTPGMRLLGVRVVRPSGSPPALWRSLLRLVGLVLSIVLLGLGFLPVLFDRKRRALQDFLAGTVVVAVPDEEPAVSPAPLAAPLPAA